jgi:hypothetical protein
MLTLEEKKEKIKVRHARWYVKNKNQNKDFRKEYRVKYYVQHKEAIKERSAKYYTENRDHCREVSAIYQAQHKDKKKAYEAARYRKIREEVFSHYGNTCACCHERENVVLTIDHVNGGGCQHRRELGSKKIYKWLIDNNFPEGYQTLCRNCNEGKYRLGTCLHQNPASAIKIVDSLTINRLTKGQVRYRKIRDAVLNYYGNQCACCPESERVFLEIDHINNNGAAHRKEIGNLLTEFLYKNKFPLGYQTLCRNCNWAKYVLGTCPHQNKVPVLTIVNSSSREENAA